MTIQTFSWDDVGMANAIEVTEVCHSIRHSYAAYSAARKTSGRIQKQFKVTWSSMSPSEWLALIEFWRSVRNVEAFYWEFPIELFGSPGWGGYGPAVYGTAVYGTDLYGAYGAFDPDDGFDAENDGVGFGDGPVFLAWFMEPTLPQRYRTGFQRWQVTANIGEFA